MVGAVAGVITDTSLLAMVIASIAACFVGVMMLLSVIGRTEALIFRDDPEHYLIRAAADRSESHISE